MSINTHDVQISTGIVGAGGWGKNLIRIFSSLSRANLTYVCDLSEDRRETVHRNYPNVTVTDTYETILQDDSVQAVVIATPADTHFQFIKQSLETNRLHVYTEKPLALSTNEAEELVAAAQKSNTILMVGHLLLYHPAVRKLKQLIDSGELGEIYCIYANRLNLGAIRKVENAWWSLAPHDISILNYLLGSAPESVSAQGQCFIQEGVADVVFATLNCPNNAIAHVHVSWLDPHKMRKVTIVGSKKMVIFDDMEAVEKIKIYDKSVVPPDVSDPVVSYDDFFKTQSGDVYIPKIDMHEPLKLECDHFLDSVINSTQPLSDGRNGLDVVKVLSAGEESMQSQGNPVMLP